MSFRDFSKTHPDADKDSATAATDAKKGDSPASAANKAAEKAQGPAPAGDKAANA